MAIFKGKDDVLFGETETQSLKLWEKYTASIPKILILNFAFNEVLMASWGHLKVKLCLLYGIYEVMNSDVSKKNPFLILIFFVFNILISIGVWSSWKAI